MSISERSSLLSFGLLILASIAHWLLGSKSGQTPDELLHSLTPATAAVEGLLMRGTGRCGSSGFAPMYMDLPMCTKWLSVRSIFLSRLATGRPISSHRVEAFFPDRRVSDSGALSSKLLMRYASYRRLVKCWANVAGDLTIAVQGGHEAQAPRKLPTQSLEISNMTKVQRTHNMPWPPCRSFACPAQGLVHRQSILLKWRWQAL